MNLPHAIRSARVLLRMSQRELAERCGLSPSAITSIENGPSGTTVATLELIANALELTLPELVVFASLPADWPKQVSDIAGTVRTFVGLKLLDDQQMPSGRAPAIEPAVKKPNLEFLFDDLPGVPDPPDEGFAGPDQYGRDESTEEVAP